MKYGKKNKDLLIKIQEDFFVNRNFVNKDFKKYI